MFWGDGGHAQKGDGGVKGWVTSRGKRTVDGGQELADGFLLRGTGPPEVDKLLRCGGRSRPHGHGRCNKAEVGEGGGRYRL